ncbi:MAG: cobalt-precorrin-5B (C(1))-methyltransferase CbiD [Ruminococcus sp.]|jgi:cobalt-precorrin-5B (C1)-methyltransferase
MVPKTGLEDYFIIKDKKKLRYGYTTGSCAAAAAKAAAYMLLKGEEVEEMALMTPKGILLHLGIEDICRRGEEVSCAVRKDGGDDPDATNGILIYAAVKKEGPSGIVIEGGEGVGRITRPGLQQPVGEAAINKVPQEMIRREVEAVCRECGYCQGVNVRISVPEGEEIGRRTFNPRLGIKGGISILGTSGIVIPMSESALLESIRVEMKMLAENGGRYLVMTPGNYGEAFSREELKLDMTYSMKCSNYVGETLQMADNLGIKGILFIAHIGKFIKVSGGIMNTHSHHGDCRAELLAAAAARAGADLECIRELLNTITTEEGIDILIRRHMLEPAMQIVLERVTYYLAHQVPTNLEMGVILFSSVHGELARSGNVKEMVEKINKQKGENDGR